MRTKCPRKKPDGIKYWYSGTLSVSKMDMDAKKAYSVYRHKKERCYRPQHDAYKYYGAKGIRVCYTPREFIAWWIEQQSDLKLKNPSVSRINHDDNYEFGNIKLEEMDENIKDMHHRLDKSMRRRTKSVVCIEAKTGKTIMRCPSLKEASCFTGVPPSTISRICSGRNYQSHGFTFKKEVA